MVPPLTILGRMPPGEQIAGTLYLLGSLSTGFIFQAGVSRTGQTPVEKNGIWELLPKGFGRFGLLTYGV